MKSTKRRFLSSLLALILCFCMLLGTTYAWFTDSVTSGVNKIVAGNLDIEVTHSNAKVATSENKSIAGEKTMFPDKNGNAMLWEPGAVSYETITVKNVGNLALKYKINMNVTDYNMVADTGDNLMGAIKVMALTGDDMLSSVTRETVLGLNWADAGTLESFQKNDGVLYPAGTASEISEETFQLIAYWQPTDNDNKWNLNNGKHNTDGFKIGDEEALFIEFGINVIATQKDYEADSFDNQYDVVDLPALPQSINKKFESAKIGTSIDEDGTATVNTVDGESAVGKETVEVVNKSNNTGVGTVTKDSVTSVVQALVKKVVADGIPADKIDITSDQDSIIYIDVKTTKDPTPTEAEYDITLSAKMDYTDNNKEDKTVKIDHLTKEDLGGNIVKVTLELGKGLKNVKVAHNSVPMAKLATVASEQEGYFYDKDSGILTIKSKSFSPFLVSYDNIKSSDLPMAYITTFDNDNNDTPIGEVDFPYNYEPYDFTSFFDTNTPNELPSIATLDKIFLFDAFESDEDASAMQTLFGKLGLSDSATDQLIKSTLEDTEKVNKAIAELDPEMQERVKNIIETRKDYLNYIADFTVEFNQDVKANTVSLWGYYASYNQEMGFGLPKDVEKGTVVPLLGSMYEVLHADVFNMDYLTICGYVRQFACGISNLSEDNIGTKVTVSLKLFPVDENGQKLVGAEPETVCKIDYYFDKVNKPAN